MVGSSFSGNHQPKEHGLLLFLNPELQLALARLQVSMKLGRSYAGLFALVEGFRKLDCIDESTYEILKAKYGQSMVHAEPKPMTKVDLKQQRELEEQEKLFSGVLAQWNEHPSENWRQKWISKAEKFMETVPNAKLILALAESENSKPLELVHKKLDPDGCRIQED